jgi:hypothetical protein
MAPVAGRVGWLLGHGGHDPQPLVMVVDQGTARPLAILEASQALGRKAAPPVGDGVLVDAHHGAIWRLGTPSAASSTIRARLAARWGVGWARTRRCSSARSASVITSGGMVGMAAAPRLGDDKPSYANN